jgi:type I restriction enzyme R subunit
MSVTLRESHAEDLINEHLLNRGWDLVDFSSIERKYVLPSRHEADYVFKLDGKIVAVLEAKRLGKDLNAALAQARGYAREIRDAGLGEANLLFASDGYHWRRQNLAARTLPERLQQFPTPAELRLFFNPTTDKLLGTLHPYQRVAVSQVLGSIQNGRQKMYLHMATASGKTITAAGVIAKLFDELGAQKFLFLVDRDALAGQTVDKLSQQVGDHLPVVRMRGEPEERYKNVLVSTIQYLAYGEKFRDHPQDFFDLVILDECHRSYFGDWHPVVEHFRSGGAWVLGLTATPQDNETVNTDRYFQDSGQPPGPIFRYTYRQGVRDGILADCTHYKFSTNVDLYGVHDMGFDFEPEALGRTVDVPERNELIAEKYFEVIESDEPVKTIVFAASIAHANHLRYALIRAFNERHDLPPEDAAAERFIVAIHNEVPGANDLIQEFQKTRTGAEQERIIQRALNDELTAPIPIIAVGVGMLDTGIDAPDVEMLVMARPTQSKVLYVQMKGRGTRKCAETGKESFKLVDFVDLARIEELVTNETPGVDDVPEEEWLPQAEEEEIEVVPTEEREVQRQEMVIADVPVWLVTSEVIAPETLTDLRRQIEGQLAHVEERVARKERFKQTILAWRYFRGDAPLDHQYLRTMGFDLSSLRDLYGQVDATLEDFVAVATGQADFKLLRRHRQLRKLAEQKALSKEQFELLKALDDFKQANPDLSVTQLLRSQWLRSKGGVHAIERLFGSVKEYLRLHKELTATKGALTSTDSE